MSVLNILLHIFVSALVGASNNAHVSPQVRNRVGVPPGMKIVRETPADCLRPDGTTWFPYCLYVMKGNDQENAGCLIGSWSHFFPKHLATMELGVYYVNRTPSDVGVQAGGGYTTAMRHLRYGGKVDATFSVPTYSKSGGKPQQGGMVLNFPTSLGIQVAVPGVGSVKAHGNGTAVAFVSTTGGSHYIHSVTVTTGISPPLNATITHVVSIRQVGHDRWNFSGYFDLDINWGGAQNITRRVWEFQPN